MLHICTISCLRALCPGCADRHSVAFQSGGAAPRSQQAASSLDGKPSSHKQTDEQGQLESLAGIDISELKAAGFSAADLRDEGYTDTQLREAGFSVTELLAPPPKPRSPPPPALLPESAVDPQLVAELNARFVSGKPSTQVLEAGILVHQV